MERNRHALDDTDWTMVRPALAARGSDSRIRRTPGASKHSKLVLRLRERRTHRIHVAARDRDSPRADLRPFGRSNMEQSPDLEPRRHAWVVHPCVTRVGFEFHGGTYSHSHGPGVSVWSLQVPSRANLDRRRIPF